MNQPLNLVKLSAAIVTFVNAVLVAVIGVGDLSWSDPKKAVAFLAVNTTTALGIALYAHFRPGTVGEPVAVGAAVTAWTASLVGVATVFGLFSLTSADGLLLQGVVVAGVALVTSLFARDAVTPNDSAQQQVLQAASEHLRNPAA